MLIPLHRRWLSLLGRRCSGSPRGLCALIQGANPAVRISKIPVPEAGVLWVDGGMFPANPYSKLAPEDVILHYVDITIATILADQRHLDPYFDMKALTDDFPLGAHLSQVF